MGKTPTTHQVCILLGSNIEPEHNIPRAVELLQEELDVIQASAVYESASSMCCYPDYLNMAVSAATMLEAGELKEKVLRPLEAFMGRVRTEDKNASRPIDLDIILFDGKLMDSDLWQHAHRAVPIADLFPNYRSEKGETLEETARRLEKATPVRLRTDISIQLPPRS